MPVKIARSTPRPSFGLPEPLVGIHTSRQSCCKAAKARIFTPVRESSGESRINTGNKQRPLVHPCWTASAAYRGHRLGRKGGKQKAAGQLGSCRPDSVIT
jgi:hypothetical protein